MTDLVHKEPKPMKGRAATADPGYLRQYLLGQLSSVHVEADKLDTALRAVMEYIGGLEPQDGVELALAAQMVAALEASMTCFNRAAAAENSALRDMEFRHAERFSNLFLRLLEGFEKRRRRTEIKRALPNHPLAHVLPY